MSLARELDERYVKALKAREARVVDTLRLFRAAIKNREIDIGSALTDDQIRQAAASEIKKRKEVLVDFERGGRDDLVDQAKQEMRILQEFAPVVLSELEVTKIAEDKKNMLGISGSADFGKLMGAVMKEVQGRSDGEVVQKIVRGLLP